MTKKTLGLIFICFFLVLAAIQLIPVKKTNPPVEMEVPAPNQVRAVLRRACYDCHSNETVWPWYSKIAPVSWLLANDVHEGRGELNFSTWNRYGTKKQADVLKKAWKEVAEGEMPPLQYRLMHPEARMTEDDKSAIRSWTTGMAQYGNSQDNSPAVAEDGKMHHADD